MTLMKGEGIHSLIDDEFEWAGEGGRMGKATASEVKG